MSASSTVSSGREAIEIEDDDDLANEDPPFEMGNLGFRLCQLEGRRY